MKNSTLTLSTLFAGALVFGAAVLRADEGHGHSEKGGHTGEAAKAAPVMNSHDGMTALYEHLGEMEKTLASGKLDGVHDHTEGVNAAVKGLDQDTTLTPEKKKRVQGYIKNTLKLSDKLHYSADGNKMDQAKKELIKLQAQVDLLDKQFAHSHKPGAEKPKEAEAHHHGDK